MNATFLRLAHLAYVPAERSRRPCPELGMCPWQRFGVRINGTWAQHGTVSDTHGGPISMHETVTDVKKKKKIAYP